MDIIDAGLQWLNEKRGQFLTRTITYTRGAQSLQLLASRGHTRHRIVDEYGRSVIVLSIDFIFSTDDFGDFEAPAVGDQITDKGKVFEVLSIAGEPHYKFCDQAAESVRVYTKGV